MKTLLELDKDPEVGDIVFSKTRNKRLLHHIIGFKKKVSWGVVYTFVQTINENGHSSENEYDNFLASFCYLGHNDLDFKELFEVRDDTQD